MNSALVSMDLRTTALVVLDLQIGVVALLLAPHSATEVVTRCARLAERLRAAGAAVILVRLGFTSDGGDRLAPAVDEPLVRRPTALSQDAYRLVPEMTPQARDIVITKRQWGAFYGTDLDLQLRRRGLRTLILTGIATHVAVESTAREAYERGFEQILVEDAMTSLTPEGHTFAVEHVFRHIGRVRSLLEVEESIEHARKA